MKNLDNSKELPLSPQAQINTGPPTQSAFIRDKCLKFLDYLLLMIN